MALHPDGLGTPYFRFIRPTAIRSGEPFSLSLLHFRANNDDLYYSEKSGILDPTTDSPTVKSIFDQVWKWSKDKNYKDVSVNKETVETEMQKGAYVFFPANRHEDPVWLNPMSLEAKPNPPYSRFDRQLHKPLRVETCAEENISWILDVLFDASVDYDIIKKFKKRSEEEPDKSIRSILSEAERTIWNNSPILQIARENVEYILREVVQDNQAKLQRKFRDSLGHRLAIQLGNGQEIPNLQSLSQGQSQLFHLFATIIRYGEHTNLNRSIRLSEITGLIIIDEIAAHLHPTLQHEVLPQLIKLFPKVQFIVSSHSPLFLLGMEKEFESEGLAILELPDGNRINSERFSEFGKAFEYYQDTKRFESEIKQLIADITKPVVMTEGKLDALYIQTALKLLGKEELLNSLEIRPVGNKGKKGDEDGGKNGLNRVLNFHKKDSSLMNQPILLLYDWDTSKPAEQIEKLWVRSIPHNPKNTKAKKGIENLLPIDLFKKRFYKTDVKEGDYGERSTITKFLKKEFCQWVCEQQNADHFANFGVIVDILKEFVETHHLPSDQQPTSE